MKSFLDGKVQVHSGDCLDVIRTLADSSIDSVVTDPPYALVSIGKKYGKSNLEQPADNNLDGVNAGAFRRLAGGFMGKQWDTGDTAHAIEFWQEVYRVLKPGGHVLAFAGTRTYHRLACAIEDAGFEIRDQIGWAFGSGFPKSHDVSKGIDKAAGAEREVVGIHPFASRKPNGTWQEVYGDQSAYDHGPKLTAPSTPDAIRWSGWGTALKPAWEPICMARKPIEGTVAQNVLKHGTGAINVDGCRVQTEPRSTHARGNVQGTHAAPMDWGNGTKHEALSASSRWPANLIHDGSDEVVGAFPESKDGVAVGSNRDGSAHSGNRIYGNRNADTKNSGYGSSGSAARFFYHSKANKHDRLGSKHPTVKPVDLMQYLVRLVTPKGGLVLDPFAGTGTTGEAAIREGCRAVLIEREPEYLADIERRCSLILAGPDARQHATIKAKAKGKVESAGPLFGEASL